MPLFSTVVAASSLGAAGGAYAFDDKVFDDKTAAEKNSNPWTVFRFGFSAYKSGHKDQAVEAYRYAAENGQLGATWKLARMYAEGDGVARDDYEAFKFFTEIAQQDVEPGSPEESYVSDALVALGAYMKIGHSRHAGRAERRRRAGILHARRRQLPQCRTPSSKWARCS